MSEDFKYRGVNVGEKVDLLVDQWQPRVIAELNDYQFKVARIQGDFIWHEHSDTDEAFFVLDGELRIDLPDGSVHLSPGELFVVPRGMSHKPYAEKEVKLMLIEPRGVRNTGNEESDRTTAPDVWIDDEIRGSAGP